MMRHVTTFHNEMAAFDAAHAHLGVLVRTRLWLERYEDGGPVNQAIVDHAERHLESHKREAVNQLLSETLGWNTLIDEGGGERDYNVTVRVYRTVEVSVYQDITIPVRAGDEDAARDQIDTYTCAANTDDYGWYTESDGRLPGYYGTRGGDIDDYDVNDVEED